MNSKAQPGGACTQWLGRVKFISCGYFIGRFNTAMTSLVPPCVKFVSNTLTSSQPSSPNRFKRSLNFWPSSLPPSNQPEASNTTVEYSHFINRSGHSAQPVIIQIWISTRFGVLSKRPPSRDEGRFIKAILALAAVCVKQILARG